MICLHCSYKLGLCLCWGWQSFASIGGLVCLGFALGLTFSGVQLIALLAVGVVLLALGFATGEGGLCERGCTAAALSGDSPCFYWLGHRPRNRLELFQILNIEEERPEPSAALLHPRGTCRKVSPVGSGFGYWSWRRAAQHRRIYMHRLKGRTKHYGLCEADYAVFYAGTTIYDASKTLDVGDVPRWRHAFNQLRHTFNRREALRGRAGKSCTFWSHPSISSISLGAWFGCSCHGNGAQAGNPSSRGLCLVEIADVEDRTVRRYVDAPELVAIDISHGETEQVRAPSSVYMKIRDLADKEPGRYVIVALGFRKPDLAAAKTLKDAKVLGKNALAPNVVVQKSLAIVDLAVENDAEKELQCERWLNGDAVLRVLFIGRARPTTAVGIRWTEFAHDTGVPWPVHRRLLSCWLFETTHVDEHDFSRETRAAQADTCSICVGCYEEDPKNWTGVSSLRDANMFTPLYLPPVVAVIVPSLGFYNFEVVCKPKGGEVTKKLLLKLLTELSAWHTLGRWNPLSSGFGRTEIRCCSGDGQFIWVDFAVNSYSFEDAFSIVMKTLEPSSLALHTGKYDSGTLKAAFGRAAARYTPPSKLATPHEVFSGKDSAPARDIGRALFGGLRVGIPPHMLREG